MEEERHVKKNLCHESDWTRVSPRNRWGVQISLSQVEVVKEPISNEEARHGYLGSCSPRGFSEVSFHRHCQ
jgi:hypothetical protein